MTLSDHPSLEALLATKLSHHGLQMVEGGVQLLDVPESVSHTASSQLRAVVSLGNGDSLRLFLKIRRVGSQAELYDGLLKIYQREEMMYNKLLPILATMQTERSKVDEVIGLFPTFYGSGRVQGDLYLVFQDIMTGTGFRVTEKAEFHTVDQVKLSLSSLGSFHALSHRLVADGRDILAEFPLLQDSLFHPVNKDAINSFFAGEMKETLAVLKSVQEVFEEEEGLSKGILGQEVKRVCQAGDLAILHDMLPHITSLMDWAVKQESFVRVVTHGDFHQWNMAFDSGTQSVKFFDLQLSRFTSAFTDVWHYISQVTTPETRREHLDPFLESYRGGFNLTSKQTGGVTVLELEAARQELWKQAAWGLVFGLTWNLKRFVTEEERWKEAVRKAKEGRASEAVEALGGSGVLIWWAVQVLLDLVTEMADHGVLQDVKQFCLAQNS